MANISFGINTKNKESINKEVSIYMRYRFGRMVDFKKTIGFKILPRNWNSKAQTVKNRNEIKNREKIKYLIKNLVRHFEDFEDELISKGKKPTLKRAKEAYRDFLEIPENNKKSVPNSLLDYFNFFLEKSKKEGTRSKETLKSYKLTQNKLMEFNSVVYPLDFDNIDMEFYYDFKEWCEKKNYAVNYIGKHIKNLKAVINEATENNINTNLEYRSRKFKVLKEDIENIYLSLEELNQIYKLDLPKNSKIDLARDLFLIGAYTGLRVSDFNNLDEDKIIDHEGRKLLDTTILKTKKKAVIPLRSEVKNILKKYRNNPIPNISDQKINELIKQVCKRARINNIVKIKKTIGGKETIKKCPKYKIVTTHTARRSFCTNAYLSGMEALDIMQLSGHESEINFYNYIKASALQKAVKISSHPFFRGENK